MRMRLAECLCQLFHGSTAGAQRHNTSDAAAAVAWTMAIGTMILRRKAVVLFMVLPGRTAVAVVMAVVLSAGMPSVAHAVLFPAVTLRCNTPMTPRIRVALHFTETLST